MDRIAMAFLFALLGSASAQDDETALDRYVAKRDPSYNWEVVDTIPGNGYTTYVLDLTSQRWRSESDVDRPAWGLCWR